MTSRPVTAPRVPGAHPAPRLTPPLPRPGRAAANLPHRLTGCDCLWCRHGTSGEGIARQRHLAAGEVIFAEGEETGYAAILVEGVARLNRSLPDGRSQIVGLAFAGDLLCDPWQPRIPHRLTSVAPVSICLLPQRALVRRVAADPVLGAALLERSLSTMAILRDWMLLLGRKTARERVATFLWEILSRDPFGRPRQVEAGVALPLPLTRQEIADLLGLTTETVSRQFSQLREEGILAGDGPNVVLLPDPLRLRAATADHP